MENRRRVTEEDLLITEALIALSYGRLKQSVVQAPSRALRSAGHAISEHPFKAAATATVAGIIAYKLLGLMTPRVVVEEDGVQPHATVKAARSRPDLMREILSVILPLAAPYVAGLIQSSIGKIHPGERDERVQQDRYFSPVSEKKACGPEPKSFTDGLK